MSEGKKANPLMIHAFALMLAGAGMATYGVVGIFQDRAEAAESAEADAPKAEAAKPEPAKPDAKHHAPAAGHGGVEDPKATAAATKMNEANAKVSMTQSDITSVQSIAQPGQTPMGLLQSAPTALLAAGRLKGTFGRALSFGVPALFILAGIVTIVAGAFVLKQRNWARYVGFAFLAAGLLFFAAQMAGTMGLPQNSPVVGALILLVATPVVAKFLWDLFVEKFAGGEPAPAAAH